MKHTQEELQVARRFHDIGREAIEKSARKRKMKNVKRREWEELGAHVTDGFIILARHALAHGYKPEQGE